MRTLRGHADWVQAVVFSPNGEWLATAGNDKHVLFWNAATGESVYAFSDPRHVVTDLAWSHDGTRIAATGFENRLRIYDAESRQLKHDWACPCRDMRVAEWSPDDRWLAAAGRDGVTRVWNATAGTHEFDYRAHRQRVRGLAFSPDGQYLATTGEDRIVHIHGVEADDEGFDLPLQNTKVLSLAFFGPHHLATGGADNLIRLWNLREQREIGRLKGPRGSIAALACRGQWLAAGCFDTTARLWTMADQVASSLEDTERAAVRTSR
jgi:WD40 repeat protein